MGDTRMKTSIRVSPNRPYTISVCGKGKSVVTLIEIRVIGQDKLQIV